MDVVESATQNMDRRYRNAQAFEHAALTKKMIKNALIYPNWIGKTGAKFWYLKSEPKSKQFRLVDVLSGSNSEIFDHRSLGQELSKASGHQVDYENLPISNLEIKLSDQDDAPITGIEFMAFDRKWYFEINQETCVEISSTPAHWLMSPDASKAIFLRNHNIWMRDLKTDRERPLTQDGEHYYAYGVLPERISLVEGLISAPQPKQPEALWSPDSTQIFTIQTDERHVKSLPVTLYAPRDSDSRPRTINRRYAMSNDEKIAEYRVLAINVETGKHCEACYPNVLDSVSWASMFSGNRAWWSRCASHAYFVDMSRAQKAAKVVSFNTISGETKLLFEEQSDTYIDLNLDFESPASLMPLPDSGELIWLSERSGWAHLYLYDLDSGRLKNCITSGEWLVREVLYADSLERRVIIQAAGRIKDRNPYFREILIVDIDTGAIDTLVSGDCDYIAYKSGNLTSWAMSAFDCGACNYSSSVSPDGKYIVTTRSRPDMVPETELRDLTGKVLLTVEIADVSALPAGWRWPESIRLKAADGVTDIYGLVFRPMDFDEHKQYPILEIGKTNPFYAPTPKGAFVCDPMPNHSYFFAAAFAELGFITLIIDGRGTCYRSKKFHDQFYGDVDGGGQIEDHVVCIKQLAKNYPYMDLNRVGIVDTAGHNGPIYALLAFPEFYKVGAVSSMWDPKLFNQIRVYQGDARTPLGRAAKPKLSVENLKGRLLIVQGLLDAYYHAGGMFQFVDRLVQANKDFDLVILPNGGHGHDTNHYGLRRIWDHLVRHLLGQDPPKNFKLSNGIEYALEKTYQLNDVDSDRIAAND